MLVAVRREKTSTALFFKYNSQLGPPYQVLVDTNFINFSIKNKVSCIVSDLSRILPPTGICMLVSSSCSTIG